MKFSNGLQLLRSLFPSWKFFDEVTYIYDLGLRTTSDPHAAWEFAPPTPKRRFFSILLNSAGNFHHAENSLLETLASDLKTVEEFNVQNLVSFQLVKRVAESRAREAKVTHFQFALIQKQVGDEQRSLEEILVSPLFEIAHD